MKLIKDLGSHYPTATSKHKARYGIYECTSCFAHIKKQTAAAKRSKTNKCASCSQKTHGLKNHRLYKTWEGEKTRCYNKNTADYKNYGERGIIVSEEFKDFPVWLKYVESLENAENHKLTLDRIDNDGNYERGNLRWATKREQTVNRRKLANNTSGYTGVVWHKLHKKWMVVITVNSKVTNLGYYNSKYLAALAYDNFVIKNNLKNNLNIKKKYV